MAIYVSWIVFSVLIIVVAAALGRTYCGNALGVLLDSRGRYSLSHFQVVIWSIVVLSLIAAVVVGKLASGASNALDFTIPNALLAVMGISVGSAVAATAVKSGKDIQNPERVAASNNADKPRLSQMVLVEEGEFADKIIDVTKFQNFWITIILVASYIGLAVSTLSRDGTSLTSLPDFSETFATLLAISHAGYIAGKLPARAGTPSGLTLAGLRAGATPDTSSAKSATISSLKYVPRNP